MARRILPIPEIATGESWIIERNDSGGGFCARKGGRVLSVPFGHSAYDQHVRAHELAHATFTPARSYPNCIGDDEVSIRVMQTVEDYRVNMLARAAGVRFPSVADSPIVQHYLNGLENALHEFVAPLLALDVNSEDRAKAREILQAKDARLLEQAEAIVSLVREEFELSFRIKRPRKGKPGRPVRHVSHKDARRIASMARDAIEGLYPSTKADDLEFRPCPVSGDEFSDARWGRVHEYQTPDLLRPVACQMVRKNRALCEGSIPINMHRYSTDGAIFSRKLKRAGGTLLIDGSGSMHWSDTQIAEWVLRRPFGEVWIYAGYVKFGPHGRSNGGILRRIAYKGRCADYLGRIEGIGCNVIDGPALRFLASRPGPRMWVSDGYVTGKNEEVTGAHLVECSAIMANGGIKRFNSFEALLDGEFETDLPQAGDY